MKESKYLCITLLNIYYHAFAHLLHRAEKGQHCYAANQQILWQTRTTPLDRSLPSTAMYATTTPYPNLFFRVQMRMGPAESEKDRRFWISNSTGSDSWRRKRRKGNPNDWLHWLRGLDDDDDDTLIRMFDIPWIIRDAHAFNLFLLSYDCHSNTRLLLLLRWCDNTLESYSLGHELVNETSMMW